MAYMIMLVSDDIDQLDEVLDAWENIHVDNIVFMDSTCFHRDGTAPPHIPMRYLFEQLDQGQRQCSVTLFGIVRDEAAVYQCIELVETIMGDLNKAENALLVAWPLSVIKGFPKAKSHRGDGS
jgi:hypothetical protein